MTRPALPTVLATSLALVAIGMACARQERTPAPPPNPPSLPPPAAEAAAAAAPARAPAALTLIYTSDLRGRLTAHEVPRPLPPGVTLAPLAHRETFGGLERRATLVDRARATARGVLQVDAGDFLPLPGDSPRDAVAPDEKDFERWRELVLAGYRRLGVDAVTLGERELGQPRQPGQPSLDPARLAAKLKAAHVPVVLANLVDGKGTHVFPPFALLDVGGRKVGVLGVTELGAEATAALAKAGYALTPPEAAARAAAHELRARGAAYVVALVHAAAGRARAAAIVAGLEGGDASIDFAVTCLGHDGTLAEASPTGSADAGVAPAPPAPTSNVAPNPASSAPSDAAAAGAASGPRDAAVAGAASRPLLLAAGGELAVGRLEVRLEGAPPPALDDAVLTLTKTVPEQLGVGLLSRVARIPLIDTDKMIADAKRKKIDLKMRDLYEIWDWGSTESCGYCHAKEVAQWKTTDHAHAFATLQRAKHDKDASCLGCHSIGFLQFGGTRDVVMARGQFANVGCEACHGPSSVHVRSVDKKKGTMRAVDPSVCLGCHTPDQNIGAFDPVAAMKEILGPGHGAPPSGSK